MAKNAPTEASADDLDNLVARIASAKADLVQRIQAVDAQIAEVAAKRQEILDTPVSEADFIEYIKSDMLKKAANAKIILQRTAAGIHTSFCSLEGASGQIPISYLGGMPGAAVLPEILYLYMTDILAGEFVKAMGQQRFCNESIPVEKRRQLMPELNKRLAELRATREQMVSRLNAIGVTK